MGKETAELNEKNNTFFTTLETARLRLRHFTDSDLAAFMAYRNDPEVAKYQSWTGISEPEARVFLQEQKEVQPGVPGLGFQIAIELKETGVLIGDCYFTIYEHDDRQAEIGYSLSRAYQGQGFATEAVSCFLTYAFLTFDLHRIIAITDCENAASVALLERLGMRREGHFLQNVWFKGKWGMSICTPSSKRNGCASTAQPYRSERLRMPHHKQVSAQP